jgi:cyclophilin family peptidyl-prolyl cis-trans isomerase
MNRMIWSIGLLAFTLTAVPSPLSALQQDEKADEEKLLKAWDELAAAVRKAKKDMSEIQLRFSGSEKADERANYESQFNALRESTAKHANVVWASIEDFLAKNPKNVAVRKRRLDDTIFDRMAPAVKVKDADTLFEVTTSGEFLHKGAKLAEKAYDYVGAVKRWKDAAARADTYQVEFDLGNACMNAFEFSAARKAFLRAAELASGEKQKKDAEQMAESAAKYVGFWDIEQELRKKSDEKKDLPIAEIITARGKIVVELFEDQAPNTVANFIELAEKGFYDGLAFHRCIAYFMIQGGDPQGNGMGGPGYNIKDECLRPDARMHFPGVLSMANTNRPDTNGSQFFVTSALTSQLNGRHTVFGRVLEGIEVAQVPPVDPADPQNKAAPFKMATVKIIRKRDHPYVSEKITNSSQTPLPTPNRQK